jgi:hypothetical protein
LFDVKGTLDIIGNKFDLMSENVKELILIVDTDKIIEFINVGPHLKIL